MVFEQHNIFTTVRNVAGPVGAISTTVVEVKGSPWSTRHFVLS
jgi:hypothetical protein